MSGIFGSMGIFRGEQLVHMAPSADRVPHLMAELLDWLKHTEEHLLVASCVFHYELEFIHPFADGNGRRLWQTLILRHWKSLLAYLPVEMVICDRQEDYYQVLATADKRAEATPFVEFMLQALLDAIREAVTSDQVTDQVARVLDTIGRSELSGADLMKALGLSHRPTFCKNYLDPALDGGWVERTQPDPPVAQPNATVFPAREDAGCKIVMENDGQFGQQPAAQLSKRLSAKWRFNRPIATI